jgi:predicted amidohydrolase YtcJ
VVTPLDPMFMIHSATTRVTRSGNVLGPEERVDVLTAIEALTINAAHQYFEEASKGSIEVGKLADFVILDKNPLTTDRYQIKDIRVLATVKEGRAVFGEF